MSEEKKSAGRKNGAKKKAVPGSASKAGRKSASGKTKTKAKRRARKPKVVLSTKKVITFCSFICCFCALFLGLSVVLNSMPEEKRQNPESAAEKTFEKSRDLLKNQKVAENQAVSEKSEDLPKNKNLVKNQTVSEKSGNLTENQKQAQPENQSGKKSASEKEKTLPLDSAPHKDAGQKSSSEIAGDVKKAPENSSKSQTQKKSVLENTSSKVSVQKKPEKSSSESAPQKSSVSKLDSQKSSSNKNSQKASVPQKTAQPQKTASAPASKAAALSSNPAPAKATASKNVQPAAAVKKNENLVSAKNQPEKKSSIVASSAGQKQNDNAQSQALKNPRFDIPKAVNGATVVIVIDDAGRSVENVKKYASLPFPLTIAVLPRLEHSRECAQASISLGKEVILHQPMQSVNHKFDPGPGKITVDMSFSEISDVIAQNLASLGSGVKGMNNHEGSEVTGDVIRIGAVLDACQKRGIYFLDSRTTAATKAPQAALERDVKIYEKAGPYLDNDISREKMLERMYETLRYANNHGHALVIGHVDKSVKILPDLLAEMYPYMKAAGYRFATPSTLR